MVSTMILILSIQSTQALNLAKLCNRRLLKVVNCCSLVSLGSDQVPWEMHLSNHLPCAWNHNWATNCKLPVLSGFKEIKIMKIFLKLWKFVILDTFYGYIKKKTQYHWIQVISFWGRKLYQYFKRNQHGTYIGSLKYIWLILK